MLPKSQRVIQREADVRRLVYWIRACCVLHNPALQDSVEAEWLEDEEEVDSGVPVAEIEHPVEVTITSSCFIECHCQRRWWRPDIFFVFE